MAVISETDINNTVIVNTPPTAPSDCSKNGDQTLYMGRYHTLAATASGSSDADGDPISTICWYEWFENGNIQYDPTAPTVSVTPDRMV